MKRIVGFALFWIAAGMLLALVIPGLFCQILCMILCVAEKMYVCTSCLKSGKVERA